METSFQEKIYLAVAKRSGQIIPLFKYVYFLVLLILVLGGYFIVNRDPLASTFYSIGVVFGRSALVLLGIVILPGILGRFGIEIKITRLITVFRRQLGILVFVLAFSHYELVRGIRLITGMTPAKFPFPLFENFGFWALTLLFFMFLTSNNWSVRKMGKWWKRLHRVVYLVLWLLVLHTGLQRISIWSVFIGIFAVAEVVSLVLRYFKVKSAVKL